MINCHLTLHICAVNGSWKCWWDQGEWHHSGVSALLEATPASSPSSAATKRSQLTWSRLTPYCCLLNLFNLCRASELWLLAKFFLCGAEMQTHQPWHPLGFRVSAKTSNYPLLKMPMWLSQEIILWFNLFHCCVVSLYFFQVLRYMCLLFNRHLQKCPVILASFWSSPTSCQSCSNFPFSLSFGMHDFCCQQCFFPNFLCQFFGGSPSAFVIIF